MKIAAFGVAAAVGVANAGVALSPAHIEAAAVCSQAPYKAYLPISALPAAQSYCAKEFPVTTPYCRTTTHTDYATLRVPKVYSTKTITGQAVVATVVTGKEPVTTKTISVPLSDFETTITATAKQSTTTVCSTSKSTTTSKASMKKRSDEIETGIAVAKAAKTTSLSGKDLSSRQALLRTVEAWGKAAKAHTVCDCIMTDPACHGTKTVNTLKTVTTIVPSVATTTVHPVHTSYVPWTVTESVTITKFGSTRSVVTNHFTVTPPVHTVSACSFSGYGNGTTTSSKA